MSDRKEGADPGKPNLKVSVQPLYQAKQWDHDIGDRVRMVGAPDIEAVVTAILLRKGDHVCYELTWVHEGEVKSGWLTTDSIMGKEKKGPVGFEPPKKV